MPILDDVRTLVQRGTAWVRLSDAPHPVSQEFDARCTELGHTIMEETQVSCESALQLPLGYVLGPRAVRQFETLQKWLGERMDAGVS